MRTPAIQLTTCMLVVHLVFGCCWHHTHQCEASCCETSAPTVGSCPCSHHHHDHSHHGEDNQRYHEHKANQQSDPEGPGEHDCEDQSCVYVTTNVTPEQRGRFIQVSWPRLDDQLLVSQLDIRHAQFRWLDTSLPSSCPPLRPHLMNQVLLN